MSMFEKATPRPWRTGKWSGDPAIYAEGWSADKPLAHHWPHTATYYRHVTTPTEDGGTSTTFGPETAEGEAEKSRRLEERAANNALIVHAVNNHDALVEALMRARDALSGWYDERDKANRTGLLPSVTCVLLDDIDAALKSAQGG